MHVKHKSLIFAMKKKLVNNYIFEIDFKNTRTKCEICSRITRKTQKKLLLTLNMYLFAGLLLSFLLSE